MALVAIAAPALAQKNVELAQQHLEANRAKYNLASEDLTYLVTDEYFTKANGITHMYLNQEYKGLPIFQAVSSLAIKDGKVVSYANRFLSGVAGRINSATPMVTPEDAVMAAAAHLKLTPTGLARNNELSVGEHKVVFGPSGIAQQDITVELLYQQMPGGELRLAWNVNIYVAKADDWWNIRIDAVNGEFLDKNNWTVTCNASGLTHKHKADCVHHEVLGSPTPTFHQGEDVQDGIQHTQFSTLHSNNNPNATMAGSYRVLPIPVESPSHGARVLVSNPDDPASSPFGWHDTNGAAGAEFTDTRGNNVNAQEDIDANNTGGTRPDGGGGLLFDYVINFGVDPPSAYRDGAITNLFYMNNIMHDVLYHYGFDEAGGNFQENNYGNGGVGSDPVEADAQDGSGTNNANFATPADGSNPRMQMFVWTAPNPDRDSDLDNGVIAHEYGHGVSNRLTGGPANVNCLNNSEQMGEGWSDYFALMFSMETGDASTDIRGIGTYVLNEPVNGPGIRPAPYCSNFGVNNYTYANLPAMAVPHGVGFVWCTMLWDMTWDLIAIHGFSTDFYNGTAGNNIAMNLVMEGMRLQPCSPGFVDGRNAILAADQALYGGAHQCLIWQAFADRGLGFSATQGSTNSAADGVAAFDLPPVCLVPTVAPTANFAAAPNPSCGAPVLFTDFSTDVPQTWAWDFGDGNTSNVQFPPAHTYALPGTYTVTLTVSNGFGSDSHSLNVTVYPAATAALANGPLYCGVSPINTTIGGTAPFTYVWSNGEVTQNITANTPGAYTMTVTDANSCSATLSATVNNGVTATVTADIPPPYCVGPNPVLTANATGGQSFAGYNVTTIPNAFQACGAGAGPVGDDATNGPHSIGFTFNYYGQPFTTFGISSNGNIQLGNGAYNAAFSNAPMPSASFGAAIALAWDDFLADAGDITFQTIGVAPNRITVICFNNLAHFGGTGGDITQGQVLLYETTDVIELHLNSTPFTSATQGFQLDAATGTTIRNGAFTSTDARRIEPIPAFTYLWSNGATTASVTANVAGTYVVTVTDDLGCTATASYFVDFACCSASIAEVVGACGSNVLTANGIGVAPLTYLWSNGETTASITTTSTGTFDVTVTDATACTASATINTVVTGAPIAVSIVQSPVGPTCATPIDLLTSISGGVAVNKAYVVSQVGPQPWGMPGITNALNDVYGVGGWSDFRYETVNPATLFDINNFGMIHMEGGDINTSELLAFLSANQTLIENWVAAGGKLLLNYASNESNGPDNLGFGGVLSTRVLASAGNVVAPGHPIFNGPTLPATGPFNGFYFSHNQITNGGTSIMQDEFGQSNLTEMAWGSGTVMFGGLTFPFFQDGAWGVQPNVYNMYKNLYTYLGGGAVTYNWSTGAITSTINVTSSGDYCVTVTDPNGCTASACQTVTINALPTVSINQTPGSLCGLNSGTLTAVGPCDAQAYYLVSNTYGEPWGMNGNLLAMDAVYGVGNWNQDFFETVNVANLLSPSTGVIFLEGSDGNADELNTFFTNNQAAIEAWVAAGGQLFLNAAPNEGGNQNWGFGGVVMNNFVFSGSANTTQPGHPIFNGPYTPITNAFTGTSFGHATIGGPAGTSLLDGDAPGVVLSELNWGSGRVMFGGMTSTGWHSPFTEAQNLRQNIIDYLRVNATVPVCCSYAWSTGEATQSINVTTSGTYTVTLTDCNGCTASNSYFANFGITSLSIDVAPVGPACGVNPVLTAVVGGVVAAPPVTYTETFTAFSDAPPAACGNWQAFRSQLTGSYTQMRIFNDLNPGITLTDPATVNAIANALFTGTALSITYGPDTYTVGSCISDFELSVNNGVCNCSNQITVRPCIGSGFGGYYASVFTDNCGGAPTQTITVEFTGGPLYNYLWSDGSTTNAITATTSGTYDVTVTTPSGCTATASQVVDVFTPPVVTIVQDPVGLSCGVQPTLTANVAGGGGVTSFSASFTQGNDAEASCPAWQSFLASLTGTYTGLHIFSDLNAGITLSDPTTVNNIANALLTGTNTSFTFGGNTYYVGNCGNGIELSVDQSICNCSNQISVRPCIQPFNANWGGVYTDNCFGPSQTITVEFLGGGGGGNNYLWSDGSTTNVITATTSGTYGVTVTDANGCTGSATQTVSILPAPVVTISQTPPPGACDGNPVTLTASSTGCGGAGGAAYYARSNVNGGDEPWFQNNNIVAMDAAFGAGNWNAEFFETLNVGTVFSPTTGFVFLEGGNNTADELNTFITNNIAAIESWVNNGGHLLLNAAPNEGGIQNWGFGGVQLIFPSLSGFVSTPTPGHPIFNGPFLPISTSYTGSYFAHATISGPSGTSLIDGDAPGSALSELNWGAGVVMFGGMTFPAAMVPNSEAQNLFNNIVDYLGNPGCTYLWSTGETTESIVVATSGTLTVTVTDASGCTGTATINASVGTPPVVSIVQSPVGPACGVNPTLAAVSPDCVGGGAAYYVMSNVNGGGQPWNNDNINALNTVLGGGNWTQEFFETLNMGTVFSPATSFVFLEGGNNNADELNTFISNNISAIEAWVAGGGRLFLNSAPNEGGSQNWGFGGVTLNYPAYSPNVSTAVPGHPIFVGPYTPITNVFSGGYFGHASISGPAGTSLIDGNGVVLSELSWGAGVVMFGGMTFPGAMSPFTEAQNLYNNIIDYMANGGTGGCTYLWSDGSTSQAITATVSGTYTVTLTNANGCSASSSINVEIYTPPTVTITSNPAAPLCGQANAVLSANGPCPNPVVLSEKTWGTGTVMFGTMTPSVFHTPSAESQSLRSNIVAHLNGLGAAGAPYYLSSSAMGQPWGQNDNINAMNANFGGSWTQDFFETANAASVFAPGTSVVVMEGGNNSSQELAAFYNANQVLIENWVAAGGRLFVNAAPTENVNINLGFGGASINFDVLSFYLSSTGDAVVPGHPVFNGPFTPIVGNFTGFSFAHSSIEGDAGTTLMEGNPALFIGGCTYLWSTGETTKDIFVNTDGTYTVTLTDANGCTGTAEMIVEFASPTVAITVDPAGPACGIQPVMTAIVNGLAPVTYSETFLGGQAPPPANCTNWDAFRAQLTGTYSQMRMYSDLDPVGFTLNDPATVNAIANALNTGSNGTFFFGPDFFNVGSCGGMELSINQGFCSCGNAYALRPCIGADVWGGVNTATCGGPTQTITVEFGGGGNFNYLWSDGSTTNQATATTSGIYGVTITTPSGCTASTSVNVFVFNPPVVTITNNPNGPFCGLPSGELTANGPCGGNCCTYLWSTGETTGTITVTTSGAYTVTLTDCNGCTNTASQVVDFTFPTVSIDVNPVGPACGVNPVLAAISPDCIGGGAAYYAVSNVNGGGQPWGQNNNIDAMDAAFGAGNWTQEFFETLNVGTVFSPATSFVFLEGGNNNADELNTFITNNIAVIESWVNSGGRLFLNAAPNEGGVQNWGFGGVQLNYGAFSGFVSTATPGHPIFNGPSLPMSTSYTGGAFAHATIVGPSGTSLIDGNAPGTVLSELNWGAGVVMFGGMTFPAAMSPNPEAQNLFNNIVDYLGNGGTGGCTYLWSDGSTSQVITATVSGTYTVTLTSPGGCTATATTNVTIYPVVTAVINGGIDVCALDPMTAVATVGTAPFTYIWNTGETTETITPGALGTYSVTITDANGCSGSAEYTETAAPVVNITADPANGPYCGVGPELTANVVGAGAANLQDVLDAINNNAGMLLSLVPNPSGFDMDAGLNSNIIFDGCSDMYDGGNVINTNFASPIQYSDNLVVPSGAFGLAGQYFTRYLGPGGCQTGPPTMWFLAADLDGVTNIYTTGDNGADGGGNVDGATFTVTNGITYNCFVKRVYNAFDPSINQLFIIPNGNFAVHSFAGNTNDGFHEVAGINSNTRAYMLLYASASGGYIDNAQTQNIAQNFVNLLGAGVTYAWSDGSTTASISPNTSGNYTVTVTDQNGCTGTASYNVVVSPAVTATINGGVDLCLLDPMTAVAGGGIAPFTYVWSTGETTDVITPTVTGTYSVTITDAAGCTASAEYDETAAPVVDITANPAGPYCGNIPVLTANTLGGGGAGGAIIPNAVADVVLNNANGGGVPMSVSYNPIFDLYYSNAGGGSAYPHYTFPGTGGGALSFVFDPYDFRGSWWNSNANTYESNSYAGGYRINDLNNGNGYVLGTGTTSGASQPNGQSQGAYDAANDQVIYYDAGILYKYSRATGNFISSVGISGLPGGAINAYAVGYSGVPGAEAVIYDYANLQLHFINYTTGAYVSSSQLPGGAPAQSNYGFSVTNNRAFIFDGINWQSFMITTGNSSTYLWSDGSTTASITPGGSGNYCVTVTDDNGCTGSACYNLVINPAVTASINGGIDPCALDAMTAVAGGGTAPFTYVWNTGETTDVITPVATGTYSVTITDASGCTASAEYNEVAAPVVSISPDPAGPFCGVAPVLNADVIGGMLQLTYSEQFLAGQAPPPANCTNWNTFIAQLSGTYTQMRMYSDLDPIGYTLNDPATATGIANTLFSGGGNTFFFGPDFINVGSCGGMELSINQGFCSCGNAYAIRPCIGADVWGGVNTPTCGGPAQTITVSFLSNTNTYLWSDGSTTSSITPGVSGNYCVTVTDLNGCTGTACYNLVVNPPVTVNISGGPTFCEQGTISAEAAGGTAPFSYLWNTGDATASILVNASGIYTVTVTDAAGCTSSATTTITVYPNPTVTVTQDLPNPICGNTPVVLTAAGAGGVGVAGAKALIVSDVEPVGWGFPGIYNAMNNVYGVGGWTEFRFESANAAAVFDLNNYRVIHMDGSDGATTELLAFLSANQGLIENWVSQGGVLLLNYATNETNNDNLGFGGVQSVFSPTGSGNVVLGGHPIFNGPLMPTSGPYGGNSFNHNFIVNGGTTLITDGNGQPTLTELPFGSGRVLFGGLTLPFFEQGGFGWTPQPNVFNMYQNIYSYMESMGNQPATYTYVWSTGSTDPTTTVNTGGTYTVTVTDNHGCTGSATYDLQISNIAVVGVPTNTTCNLANGAIDLTTTGAITPVTYLWDNGATTEDLTGLLAGTYVVTATDVNGCTATTEVTVNNDADVTPPTITCPGDITVNNDLGQCGALVTFAATATDNCGTATLSYSPASGSAFVVGTTTVTAVANDGNGNTSSCSFTVTVNDTEAPALTCPSAITVNVDANTCGAAVTFEATATDNCPGATITYSQISGSTFAVGTTTLTATAVDAANNSTTCTFTVTVVDNIAPEIGSCAGLGNTYTIVISQLGGFFDEVSWSFTDANNVVIASGGPDAPGTYTATSNNGPFSFFAETLGSFNDNILGYEILCGVNSIVSGAIGGGQTITESNISCGANPADITQNVDAGSCGAVVTFSLPATDNCPGVTVDYVPASGTTFPVGVTTVTATATDASNNTATCSFNVTVTDNEVPVVTCPGDITVSNDPGQCGAIVTFVATATDNCSAIVTYSQGSGSLFFTGTTLVTATATDPSGNVATCTFNVTVNDTEAPVVTCPGDITVPVDAGLCGAVVTFAATAIDNCAGFGNNLVVNPGAETGNLSGWNLVSNGGDGFATVPEFYSGTSSFIGSYDWCIREQVIDLVANGYSPAELDMSPDIHASEWFKASVCCSPTDHYFIRVELLNSGMSVLATYAMGSELFPAASTSTWQQASYVFMGYPTGVRYVRFIDGSKDTEFWAGQYGTVIDDAEVRLAQTANIAYSPASGSVFPTGTTVVTATATDASGNISTCTFNVTVNDTEVPAITCPADQTLALDNNCQATLLDYTGMATSSDNCPIGLTVTQSPAAGTLVNGVATTSVVLTATDASGNTATCAFNVNTLDNTAPSLTCPADQAQTGNSPVLLADYTGMTLAADCAGVTLVQSPAAGTPYLASQNVTVTMTATDPSGNVSTCSFNVLVTIGNCGPGNRIYVDDNPAGAGNNGTSWFDAFLRLEDALAIATPGSEIWVKEGTYKPTPTNNRTIFYNVPGGVQLYGGFPQNADCNATLLDRDADVYLSVLSGDIGVTGVNTDNSYCLIRALNVGGAGSIIDGFVLRDAYSDAQVNTCAMVINADGTGNQSSPEVVNCDFINNYNDLKGGAVYIRAYYGAQAAPVFTGCNFIGNSAFGDGGVVFSTPKYSGSQANATFSFCNFSGNSTLSSGGVVYSWTYPLSSSYFLFDNCTFDDNTAGVDGGAIANVLRNDASSTFIYNNSTFTNNVGRNGSAVYNTNVTGASQNDYTDCTFENNTASAGGTVYSIVYKGGAVNNFNRVAFRNNVAVNGGGSYEYNYTNGAGVATTYTNCVFYDNNASGNGGAVYALSRLGTPYVGNISFSTFYGNTAGGFGGAIADINQTGINSMTVANCILRSNLDNVNKGFYTNGVGATMSVNTCIVPSTACASLNSGTGSFSCSGLNAQDPLFVNAPNGDLHIMAGSSAIDLAVTGPSVDHDGAARPSGVRFDLGAYEYGAVLPRMLADGETVEAAISTIEMNLFPNPTTDKFTINFGQEVTGKLEVLDLQGRVIMVKQVEQSTSIDLAIGGRSSGTYFVRLITDREIMVRPIVLQQP